MTDEQQAHPVRLPRNPVMPPTRWPHDDMGTPVPPPEPVEPPAA